MKAFVVLCFLVVFAYAAWHLLSPEQRVHALRFMCFHAPRLGTLLLVLCVVAYVAYYLSTNNLFIF